MFIKGVTWRHRNDFHFTAKCPWCGHEEKRRDGYADAYFCMHVVPGQHCPKCGFDQQGHLKENEAGA